MKRILSFTIVIMLLFSVAFSANAVIVDTATVDANSGICGENLSWSYDGASKTLTISGSGAMSDFQENKAPWIDCDIEAVVIEQDVTTIGDYAFINLMGMSSIEIADSVVAIGDYAFAYCERLRDITLPDNLQVIGRSAFYYCYSLKSVTIPKSVLTIDGYAFDCCENLTDVTILNMNCDIYDSSYTIYETAKIYGGEGSTAQTYAQKYKRSFTAIEIEAVENTGECGENVSWSYDEETKTLTISGSGDMADYSDSKIAPYMNFEIENVVVEDGVTGIGDYAFIDCETMLSVMLPDTLTKIGSHAFDYCSSVTQIDIPANVTTLGEYAFSGCMSLQSITIPNRVETLPECVFGACLAVKGIYIPSSVVSIDKLAFNGCLSVESIVVSKDNTVFDSREACNAIVETATNTLYLGCKGTFIPSTVTSIGERAFYIDHGPENLVIPGTVKEIGDSAFSTLISLSNLRIEEGVEVIGDYAFSMTQNIKKLTIPKSVTYIGNGAFGFSMITELTILNPDCEIYDHSYTLPDSMFINIYIYGYEGSTAQAYAQKYNRTFVAYEQPQYKLGDVDLDGIVTVLDATAIQKDKARIKTLTYDQVAQADVDSDGIMSVLDATRIQMMLAQLL